MNEVIREKIDAYNKCHFVVGYCGLSTLIDFETQILNKASKGNFSFKLHLGLAHWEGLSEKIIVKLEDLHYKLQEYDTNSGVWIIAKNRYHGKLYLFGNMELPQEAIVGSSNFSDQGLSKNYEVNLQTNNKELLSQLHDVKTQLQENSYPFSSQNISIKGVSKKSKLKLDSITPPEDMPTSKPIRPADFFIPLRAQPMSSLNLHFGRGRKNKKTGVITPRPYYEVEVTLQKKFWANSEATKFIPNQIEKAVYWAITDTSEVFECNFHRKSGAKSDKRPLHETGGEFQSTPREALGKYLKNKLINSNCLSFGEPVTQNVLDLYGSQKIKVWKLSQNKLYLSY